MKLSSIRHAIRPAWPLLLVVLAGPLFAGEKLSSSTLVNWQALGSGPTGGPGQTVVLRPGAGLTRSFPVGTVEVRLASHPYFSATATGLPTLEVGPAALTFLRDQNGGALILLGDQPLMLPNAIPLSPDGYSQAPLDLRLSYDPGRAAATLAVDGKSFTLAASAPAGPIVIMVSAGDTASWTLDTLEVSSLANGPGKETRASAGQERTTGLDAQAKVRALRESADARARLGDAVLAGKLSPEEALAQLRKLDFSQQPFSAETAFALAAIQLGETLVANVRFDAAELFFRAAEPALVAAHDRSGKRGEQALCLKQLAWIRSRYLKQEAQALVDAEAASRLKPKDKNLQQLRQQLTERNLQRHKESPRS